MDTSEMREVLDDIISDYVMRRDTAAVADYTTFADVWSENLQDDAVILLDAAVEFLATISGRTIPAPSIENVNAALRAEMAEDGLILVGFDAAGAPIFEGDE